MEPRPERNLLSLRKPVAASIGTAHITSDAAGENSIVAISGANDYAVLSERDLELTASSQVPLLQRRSRAPS